MKEIRVAIADDHQIFRKGVILSLRHCSYIKFVLEANNGEELLQGIPNVNPDVILMDLRMPVKDGIETTKAIHKLFPNIHVIVLTMHDDEQFVAHLLENGANGYLLKNSDAMEIKKAIDEVMEKGFYLNNFVNRILLKHAHKKVKTLPSLDEAISISQREKEMLQLLCQELTAVQIADKMQLSSRTVEAMKDRLMERFGVSNSVGLVYFAMKNFLLEDN